MTEILRGPSVLRMSVRSALDAISVTETYEEAADGI
jgi:hypothetical protein